jgi:hypothetical protein
MKVSVAYYSDGTLKRLYLLDEHDEEHSNGGPACYCWHSNGQEYFRQYCLHGEFHREDGPAFQSWDSDGSLQEEYYYLHGEKLSKKEWEKRIQKKVKIEVEGEVKWISRESAEVLGLV